MRSEKNTSKLTRNAVRALTQAVAKVVEEHQRQGRPLAVWRNGKAVWISAAQGGALQETPIPYRTRPVKRRKS